MVPMGPFIQPKLGGSYRWNGIINSAINDFRNTYYIVYTVVGI